MLHSGPRDEKHFGTLVVSDAFALTDDEREFLSKRVADKKTYKGRSGDVSLLTNAGILDLPLGGFDVVIGNPPWQEAPPLPRGWAAAFRLPEGEGAYSQLFIHRALTLLREGGRLGLLVGMKVFWNDRDTSRAFRSHLLAHAALKQIVNMAHVRRVFFAKAVAPFAFLLAEKRPPAPDARVVFWNARRVGSVERLRSIAAVPLDRRIVAQTDLTEADYLWKLYWWGGHHDAALVARLGLERTLGETVENTDPQPRYGWQRGTTVPSGKLATLFELNNKKVEAFGPAQEGWFLPPPSGIKRDPDQRIYSGQRLVITRGVREPIGPIARLEKQEFSFRHSFYCIPLPHLSQIEAKLTLGTLWSSLGRYLLFMTAGNWGGWHDQVTSRDVLRVPMRLKPSWGMPKTKHNDAAMRIVQAVSQLRELPSQNPHARGLFDASSDDNPKESWLAVLDEAIFDLFELTKAERDLVEDFWAENHELYWKGAAAEATKRLTLTGALNGTRANLSETWERSGLQPYLRAFLEAWNEQLPKGSEFRWQVVISPARDAVAVVFTLSGVAISAQQGSDRNWETTVAQCAKALNQPISPAFYTKRVIRAAAADNFIILRENTRRLWTASTAREDAEALFVQLAVRSEG